MDLRPLGRTGLMVSPLALGTVKLGRNRGLKYPSGDGQPLPSDEQAMALLVAAADAGINLIDTAPAYGLSEERLGNLLAASRWLGGRDRWIVSTKVGEEFDPATGESRFDFSPRHVRYSVERSLRRLQTDVLDLVLVHSGGDDEWVIARSGALETLRQLQREGLVRAVGLSPKTLDGALQAMRSASDYGGACDVVMIEYSPVARQGGLGIDAARLRGVGVLVKKALGSGHLEGVLSRTPPEIRAASLGTVEAALRFALGKAGVTSVVLGTSNAEHLRANAEACERALSKPA